MSDKPEAKIISADDVAGSDKIWIDSLVTKHSTASRGGLEEIFTKYEAQHAQDQQNHRAKFDERMRILDADIKAITEKIPAPVEAPKAPEKKDPFIEKVDAVLNQQPPQKQFKNLAIANFPSGLEVQVDRFKEEIRAVNAIIENHDATDTKLLVHLADTEGMRKSRNLDIAHKAAFILYTAARQNGVHMSLATGMFADVLNPEHSVKQISAFNASFSWYGKRNVETLDKMLSAQKTLLDKAGDPAGYSHVVFIADNSLKTGDAAFCAETIRDMNARHPNIKWDIVLMPTAAGEAGRLSAIADMFPNMRFTEIGDLNTLPHALAQLAVTPFGVPVTIAQQSALKTENLLLRHFAP